MDNNQGLKKAQIQDILSLAEMVGEKTGDPAGWQKRANEAIAADTPVDEFKDMAFQAMVGKLEKAPMLPSLWGDMSAREQAEYRTPILDAIRLQIPGQDVQGITRDVSQQLAKRHKIDAKGILIDIGAVFQQRTLTAQGTGPAGGYLVGTETLSGNFIELLRAKSLVQRLGATVLPGLISNILIPGHASGTAVYHIGEQDAVTPDDSVLLGLAMSPTTAAARTSLSRLMVVQSSLDMENFTRNDLAAGLATAVDAKAINGTGADDEPTGILNTSNIGDVAGGTNGLAPAYSHLLELEADVAVANADVGALGYLTNPLVRKKLKQIYTNATYGEVPLWATLDNEPGFGRLNGYRAGCSTNCPSDLTKGSSSGVCSAIIFGNFADLVIGYWGALDLIVDPFTDSAKGQVNVTAFLSYDVGARHAGSFSAMQDALTT